MEKYKGIIDKEGYKLGIEKYELECTRAFVFAEGNTISDVSLIYLNHKGKYKWNHRQNHKIFCFCYLRWQKMVTAW